MSLLQNRDDGAKARYLALVLALLLFALAVVVSSGCAPEYAYGEVRETARIRIWITWPIMENRTVVGTTPQYRARLQAVDEDGKAVFNRFGHPINWWEEVTREAVEGPRAWSVGDVVDLSAHRAAMKQHESWSREFQLANRGTSR